MLGLSVVVYPDTRQYSSVVMNGYKGFKALIHNAHEFPEVGSKGFAIGSGKEVLVGIGAQYTTASTAVEDMSFDRRKCVKHNENPVGVKLEVFTHYDQKACLMECQAKQMYDKCGCLPYYYPDFTYAWKKDTSCDLIGKKLYRMREKNMFLGF